LLVAGLWVLGVGYISVIFKLKTNTQNPKTSTYKPKPNTQHLILYHPTTKNQNPTPKVPNKKTRCTDQIDRCATGYILNF